MSSRNGVVVILVGMVMFGPGVPAVHGAQSGARPEPGAVMLRSRGLHGVEKIHAHWSIARDYMPPPTRGTLVRLDPALLVTPPKGLEVGYVPIVTRQEDAGTN